MSKEDCCRHGYPNCEFDHEREQTLVRELMHAIEKDNIDICPLCLRDTMLAVAALLHLEAAKTGQATSGRPPPRARKLGDELAKAARTALEEVSSAKAALVSSSSRN